MPYNILVVDDSKTVRSMIRKTLDLGGVAVGALREAANGREALEILRAEWIDLVFADINMPVMTGLEMVERMGQEGLLATVPVVIVTTEGSATRVEQLKAKGIRAYVRKPFTPELLRGVVEEVLGARHAG